MRASVYVSVCMSVCMHTQRMKKDFSRYAGVFSYVSKNQYRSSGVMWVCKATMRVYIIILHPAKGGGKFGRGENTTPFCCHQGHITSSYGQRSSQRGTQSLQGGFLQEQCGVGWLHHRTVTLSVTLCGR